MKNKGKLKYSHEVGLGNLTALVEIALEYKGHDFFNVIMASKKGKSVKETLIETLKKRYNKEQKAKEFIKALNE